MFHTSLEVTRNVGEAGFKLGSCQNQNKNISLTCSPFCPSAIWKMNCSSTSIREQEENNPANMGLPTRTTRTKGHCTHKTGEKTQMHTVNTHQLPQFTTHGICTTQLQIRCLLWLCNKLPEVTFTDNLQVIHKAKYRIVFGTLLNQLISTNQAPVFSYLKDF